MALPLQNCQHWGQTVKLRHSVGLGALESHNNNCIAGEFSGLKGRLGVLLIMEHAGRRLNHVMLLIHGRDLNHSSPQGARQTLEAPGCLKRCCSRAYNRLVQALLWAGAERQPLLRQKRLFDVVFQPDAGHCFGVSMQKARLKQLPNHKAQSSGRVEMVHICQSIWIDPRQERHHFRQICKILPIQNDTPGPRHGDEMDQKIGGPPCGHQPDNPIGIGFLIKNLANRRILIA